MIVLDHWNHLIVIALMMTGFYVLMARTNLVKKLLGLSILQASVILLYVTMARVDGGTAAILPEPPHHEVHADDGHVDEHADGGHDDDHADDGQDDAHAEDAHGGDHDVPQATAHDAHDDAAAIVYSNPIPHVLMLTAIVVGVATTALGLALVVRIQAAFGTVDDDALVAIEEGDG